MLGHCSSGAAFMAALSIGIDDRKSRDTDAGLRPVTGPRKRDLFKLICCAKPVRKAAVED